MLLAEPASPSGRRALLCATLVVAALYVWLRLLHLGKYSLWYDEVFSAAVAQSSWTTLFRHVLTDKVHPPLFYIILKIWMRIVGSGVARLRLLSVFFSVLAIFPFWKSMRLMGLSRELRVALGLAVATNPFLILYSQEVRMYALLWLLAATSLCVYLQVLADQRPRNLLLFAVTNGLLTATHFAGLAIVASECGHWCLRRPAKKFVLYGVLPAAGVFVSWIVAVAVFSPHTVSVAQNVSWIPKPTLAAFWHSFGHLLGGKAAALVFQIPIIAALWMRRRRDNDDLNLLFVLGSAVTIVGMFAISRMMKPIWQDRYLIAAVVPYYLLLGLSVQSLSKAAAQKWIAAIAILAAIGLEYDLTHSPDRPSFDSFTAVAAKAGVQDFPVLASDDLVGAPLEFGSGGTERNERIPVVTGISRSANGELQFELRRVFYSQGEYHYAAFDRKTGNRRAARVPKEFVYAYDAESGGVIEQGQSPSQLASLGCSLQDLAQTKGEGHTFTLYKVRC